MNTGFMRNKLFLLAACCLLAVACKDDRPLHPVSPGESSAPDVPVNGITYQLNVYSFADSDGDGWGDLKGIVQHLDYLESLGVKALWLSPVQKAQSYHGYNITDYSTLNPKFGTESDFKDLIAKASARGIAIYLDYVINHSGSGNTWFQKANASATSPYRSYYVFSNNPSADEAAGTIDNYAGATSPGMGTWYSSPGGGYYFASFGGDMPDINYGPYDKASSSESFKALAASADKWIKMGVAGLRLDAVQWIYQNQTEANVAFLTQWYDHCNATWKASGGKGDIYMVGECLSNVNVVTPYFKGLPSMFDFSYWWTLKDRINTGKGDDFASVIAGFRKGFKNRRAGYVDAIKLSNHDESRAAEDLGKSLEKEKLAAAVLLTSPGKPFIYQGEELGYYGNQGGGDEYVRTPIKWTRTGSVPTVALNGKVDNNMLSASISVEAQTADANSLLNHYRAFTALRNGTPALLNGEMTPVTAASPQIAAWKMLYQGDMVLVLHNFSSTPALAGSFSTIRELIRNGEVTVSGKNITLGAYSSVVYKI